VALAAHLILAVGLTHCATAAEESPPLSRYVPADAGLCVEVTNLGARLDDIRASELYRRVRKFPPLARFLTDNAAEIGLLTEELRQQTGLSFEELLRRFFGQQVLVAVWPCQPGNDLQPGPALALVNCPDAALLENVATRLIAAERAAGRRVQRGQWRNGDRVCVIHRIDANAGQPALYMANVDHLGILATDEALVQQVLSLHADKSRPSLADRSEYMAGVARLNPAALVRIFVDPAAWHDLIAAHAVSAGELPGGAEDWLARHFRQADYFVASCEWGERIVGEAFLHNRLAATSEPTTESPTNLAAQIPAEAVAAFAGRVDLLPLLTTFFSCESSSPTPARADAPQSTQHEPRALTALVSMNGPRAVAALVPRTREPRSATRDDQPTAFDWVVGFDTHGLLPDDRLALTKRIDPLLRAGLTAAIVMYNRQGAPTSIDSIEDEGVPLTTVGGLSLLGKGDAATFSLLKSYFWAGTSRAAVRDIARLDTAQSLATQAAYRRLTNPRISSPTHLAYVDLTAVQGMLNDSGGSKLLPDGEVASPAGSLREIAALADRLLIEIQVDTSGVAMSATLVAEQPPAR